VRKFTYTNTYVLIGRRLTTTTATAWTIGARIFVELEEPAETSADLPESGPLALHCDCQSKNRLTALGTVNGAWLSARKPFRRLIDGGENFDHLLDFGQFKAIVDHRFDRSNAEPASRTLELA